MIFNKGGLLTLVVFLFMGLKAIAGAGFNTTHTCDSYVALEAEMNCGPQSYIPHFALPYCERYLQQASDFSFKAQGVLAKIRSCLQEKLLAQADHLNCENIQDIGVNSHYTCYIESGFCDLKDQDIYNVMWIAKAQVFNWSIIYIFSKVLNTCDYK